MVNNNIIELTIDLISINLLLRSLHFLLALILFPFL